MKIINRSVAKSAGLLRYFTGKPCKNGHTEINDDEFKKCWSIDNLQPMWRLENISKGKKIVTA